MILLIYITCKNVKEAKKIGKHLLNLKLAACINILPKMTSIYFWPESSIDITESSETVLIAKTLEDKYLRLEKAVKKIHSYDNPCIMAISVKQASKNYIKWLERTLDL